jgi:DNA-binding MarR family transcriptional regulator
MATRNPASMVRSNFIARDPSQRASHRQATVNRPDDSGKEERISRHLPRRNHVERPHSDDRNGNQDDYLNGILCFGQARTSAFAMVFMFGSPLLSRDPSSRSIVGLGRCGRDLTKSLYMYIHLDMRTETPEPRAEALFDLPCACQNLRRATRVVTRIYDQELAKAGIEITPFGLLTALDLTGEANQKRLSAGFAMDSTTLTRTLRLMLKQGWIRARRGKDKRERLFSLTRAGRRQLATAQPFWEAAQRRLRKELGEAGWTSMKRAVSQTTGAALAA